MTTRTSKKTVVFRRPFVLGDFDEVLPAGAYSVETDEELLEGISFPAYRRVLTVIQLHAKRSHPGRMPTLTIDPAELAAALKRDQEPAHAELERDPGQGTAESAEGVPKLADAMKASPRPQTAGPATGIIFDV
jgi:hypothetical protein